MATPAEATPAAGTTPAATPIPAAGTTPAATAASTTPAAATTPAGATGPMDPTVAAQLSGNLAAIMQSNMQDSLQRTARQADASAIAHTSYNAAAFRMLAAASDPEATMDYNTASHVPVNQPYMAPGYVAAPQPTASVPVAH